MIKRRGEQHHGAGLVREAKSDRNAEQQRPHPYRCLQQRKAHQDEAAGDRLRRSVAGCEPARLQKALYITPPIYAIGRFNIQYIAKLRFIRA